MFDNRVFFDSLNLWAATCMGILLIQRFFRLIVGSKNFGVYKLWWNDHIQLQIQSIWSSDIGDTNTLYRTLQPCTLEWKQFLSELLSGHKVDYTDSRKEWTTYEWSLSLKIASNSHFRAFIGREKFFCPLSSASHSFHYRSQKPRLTIDNHCCRVLLINVQIVDVRVCVLTLLTCGGVTG